MPVCSKSGRVIRKRWMRYRHFYDFDYYGKISRNCFCIHAVVLCSYAICVCVASLLRFFTKLLEIGAKIPSLKPICGFAILLFWSNIETTRSLQRTVFCCCCKNRYAIINRILTLHNAHMLLYCFRVFCVRFQASLAIAIHSKCHFVANFRPISFLCSSFYAWMCRCVRLSKWYFFFSIIIIIHKLKAKTLFLWAKCMIMSDFLGKFAYESKRIFDDMLCVCVSF